jgi:serine/threonine-protein kinase HipA
MIRIWTDGEIAGALDRLGKAGTSFAYKADARAERAVSITMPHRVPSYDWSHGLVPIFEMNVPEGALRARLIRSFAKATGTFDDFDLLSIVGRSQLGRIRYSAMDGGLDEETPFQSVDEILRARRDGGLFDHLLDRFAQYSGLSGVQPKVMIRDEGKFSAGKARRSSSLRAATHIVKLWDKDEYPELAANEYFCLLAAQKAGLDVPRFTLSDSGDALIIERFDLSDQGYLGVEDFCVLNGVGAAQKYAGSYESRLFKRARDFIEPADHPREMQALYRLFVLNCALRNGDAHLKNFALTYDRVDGPSRLAPVYDLVTTRAYLPEDSMALTLEGSTRWPDAERLMRLGQLRAELSPTSVTQIFEATADAMSDAWKPAAAYFANCTEPGVGERMKSAWEDGMAEALGLVRSPGRASPGPSPRRIMPLARSQAVVLERLRAEGGTITGTLGSIAARLSLPASTLSGALRVLEGRGLIVRDRGSVRLTDQGV